MPVEPTPAVPPVAPSPPAAPPVAPPTPPAPAYTPPAPTYPVAQAPTGNTVNVPIETFQALTQAQTRLVQIEEQRQRDAREAATREAEQLAESGRLKEGLAALRLQKEQSDAEAARKVAEIEDRTRQYALEREINGVLAGEDLVPGVAPQLLTLLKPNFNVNPRGNTYDVQTHTLQSVAAYVKEFLARPEGQIYVKAGHTGGASPSGGHLQPPGTSVPTPAVAPPNLAIAALLQSKAIMEEAQQKAGQNLPAELNPAVSFGLGRKKA